MSADVFCDVVQMQAGRGASVPLAMLLLLLAFPLLASAQISLPWRETLALDGFSTFDTTKYAIGDDATWKAPPLGWIELTPEAGGKAGRLYLKRRRLDDYFSADFLAWFGVNTPANNSGADGIVFATARSINYPIAGGGQLDFDGCEGYGYEFDTYENGPQNDPNAQHIAVVKTTTSNHLHYETCAPSELESGSWHRISITNSNGFVKMYLDGADRFTYTIPGYVPELSYFGFTSGTGTGFNEHRVDSIRITVPTRARSDLGVYSACDTTRLDRVIRISNNHPSGLPLLVAGGALVELDRTGEFRVTANPVPFTVAPGDSIALAVRFTGTGAGTRRCVLALAAASGETIEDTLVLNLVQPQAALVTSSVAFPRTLVGAWREQQCELRNTGIVPLVVTNISAAPAEFTVRQPGGFPITVPPGGSIVATVRFTPTVTGTASGTLAFNSSCGDTYTAALQAEGYDPVLLARLDPAIVMISTGVPGGRGCALATIALPAGALDVPLYGLAGALSFDPDYATFTGYDILPVAWDPARSGANVAIDASSPGRIQARIVSPLPLLDGGPLLRLWFCSTRSDTGCTALTWDSLRLNPEGAFPGLPRNVALPARICINPSCRVPEGLVDINAPRISATPNPFNPSTTLSWFLPSDGHARIDIFDAVGKRVATAFDGPAAQGEHRTPFDAGALPSGSYRVVLLSADSRFTPVTVVVQIVR